MDYEKYDFNAIARARARIAIRVDRPDCGAEKLEPARIIGETGGFVLIAFDNGSLLPVDKRDILGLYDPLIEIKDMSRDQLARFARDRIRYEAEIEDADWASVGFERGDGKLHVRAEGVELSYETNKLIDCHDWGKPGGEEENWAEREFDWGEYE